MYVAGVDGCRAGWVVALLDLHTGSSSSRVVKAFDDVLALPEAPRVIGVDMPIGLLDAAEPGGRDCDRLARALLGRPRGSSVFSPPARGALAQRTFALACKANRASSRFAIGVSQQCFHLFDKLRELDAIMTPSVQARVVEVHPELCFHQMLRGKPMLHGKKTPSGRAARSKALAVSGLLPVGASAPALPGAAADDVLDAFAVSWTARRIHTGRGLRLPAKPPVDARGLRMEIWR